MLKKHRGMKLPTIKTSPETKRQFSIILIVAMIVGSTVLSYEIRTQDLNHAVELDEFDPYFNYRATKYLYENGYEKYTIWHDTLSWYPIGRDISATSQNALHIIAAYTYMPFSSYVDLYTYTIYFPAVIGSITTIVMFLLVRVMAGNGMATLAATFFAISVPFIQRGTGGWFKSEPLGLFLGFLGLYLFISMVNRTYNTGNKNKLDLLLRATGAGILIAIGISAWGGVIFFMIPIALWLIIIPIKGNANKLLCVGIAVFTVSLLAQSTLFDRAEALTFGLASVCVIGPFLFILTYIYIPIQNKKIKYIISLALISSVFLLMLISGIIDIQYGRYIGALIPFTVSDALTQSVSEHQIPTFGHIFERTVFMLIFAPVGVFALIKNRYKLKHEMHYLILILGAVGIYVGSTYVRLELFMSFGLLLFSSIGIMYLFKKISLTKHPVNTYVLVAMLLVVMMLPAVINWSIMMDRPPLIMFGASTQGRMSGDWPDALNYIRTQTPTDSKIMAWWDYGYWIETKGERTTYMDNAAFHSDRISNYANILTDVPDVSVTKLKELEVDYVLIYFLGKKTHDEKFILKGGGDESKMHWILKIGGRDISMFIDKDRQLNNKFYSDTFYGSLIPFTPTDDGLYYNPNKLPDGVRLVYTSPEFINPPDDSLFNAVLIYEITY